MVCIFGLRRRALACTAAIKQRCGEDDEVEEIFIAENRGSEVVALTDHPHKHSKHKEMYFPELLKLPDVNGMTFKVTRKERTDTVICEHLRLNGLNHICYIF